MMMMKLMIMIKDSSSFIKFPRNLHKNKYIMDYKISNQPNDFNMHNNSNCNKI